MMALGAALVAYRLHRDGRLRHIPDPTADTERFLSAYRANLEAQAALLESVPRWYLAPLVPGLVTFYVGFVVREPATWWAPLILLAISLLVFAAIGWMNRVGARKLRAQAAKLGA
jgi:Flp pilus assembly protein TadB